MHKRMSRLFAGAMLVAAALTGGFFVFEANRDAESILRSRSDVSTHLNRLIVTAGEIASAQQAYVAPGQPNQTWIDQAAARQKMFSDDLAAVRPRLRSIDAARNVAAISEAFRALVTIDQKARLDVQEGQELLAADLIFSEG